MSHARNLAISQRDFYRLDNLSLACRGLESLLITQDADECSNAQIKRNQHHRRRDLTGRE